MTSPTSLTIRGLSNLPPPQDLKTTQNQLLLSNDSQLEYSPYSDELISNPLYVVFIHRLSHKGTAVYKRGIFFLFVTDGYIPHESESAGD
ncbi:hypothetical protein C7G83_11085 [Siccibacter turicensis]|uniref:Uncharacterized protein n=1 Tax=Siccibacter turicensis TaxID=357233 RepID=A0A2P8VJE1_9ENTR|nr:hypothetical protein C7G83_11085 [Siccibacter turicensis]